MKSELTSRGQYYIGKRLELLMVLINRVTTAFHNNKDWQSELVWRKDMAVMDVDNFNVVHKMTLKKELEADDLVIMNMLWKNWLAIGRRYMAPKVIEDIRERMRELVEVSNSKGEVDMIVLENSKWTTGTIGGININMDDFVQNAISSHSVFMPGVLGTNASKPSSQSMGSIQVPVTTVANAPSANATIKVANTLGIQWQELVDIYLSDVNIDKIIDNGIK